MSSSSASSSSSRSPSPEPPKKSKSSKTLKRKLQQDDDDASEASDIDAVAVEKPKKTKKSDKAKETTEDFEMAEENDTAAPDQPALSHAERRRQQKKLAKQKAAEEAGVDLTDKKTSSKKRKLKDGSAVAGGEGDGKGKDSPAAKPRQNSVWVGNMSFKTTQDNLRTFFESCGEITRVNLPVKPGRRPNQPVENRGFAYVDFATPEAKAAAIALSEKPLVGRKLLIKDGDDFAGRPIAPGTDVKTADPALSQKVHSKTAQKILRRQKQPPGPTLFVGNLPFETTEDDIRTLFESHRPPVKKEKGAWKSSFISEAKDEKDKGKEDDQSGSDSDSDSDSESESDSGSDDESEDEQEKKEKIKPKDTKAKVKQEQKKPDYILKIRMGNFEDSGACKGFTFIDFTSIDNATSALINIKNHHFNGRELKVEYAGLDAIRRGAAKHLVPAAMESKGKTSGAPRKPREGGASRAGGDREGGNGRSFNARPPRGDHAGAKRSFGGGDDAFAGNDTGAPMEVDYEAPSAPVRPEGPDRRFRKEFDKKGRARPTPGAALALAKRETAGIVPSEGKKITF